MISWGSPGGVFRRRSERAAVSRGFPRLPRGRGERSPSGTEPRTTVATLITLYRDDGKPGELYLIVPARKPPKPREWASAEEFAASGGFVADVTMTSDGRWKAAVPMLPGCT